MKEYIKIVIPYIIVIIILGVLLFCRGCNRCVDCPDPEINTTIIRDTIRDTIKITSNGSYTPTATNVINPNFDTNNNLSYCKEIIWDYNKIRIYNDTIMNDSVAFIVINDSVMNNRIKSRNWEFESRVPTVINSYITTYTYDTCKKNPTFDFGIGINCGYYIGTNNMYVGPTLGIRIKKTMIGINCGLTSDGNKYVGINYVKSIK